MGTRKGSEPFVTTSIKALGKAMYPARIRRWSIAGDIPPRSLDRYALFADQSLSIDLEPRIFTTEEFLKKIEQGDRFAIESIKIGIPLFGEDFIHDLKLKCRVS